MPILQKHCALAGVIIVVGHEIAIISFSPTSIWIKLFNYPGSVRGRSTGALRRGFHKRRQRKRRRFRSGRFHHVRRRFFSQCLSRRISPRFYQSIFTTQGNSSHSFTHSLTHSLIASFIHSFIHSLTPSFIPLLPHLFTLSLTHSFPPSLTHSFTHSTIQ